MSDWKAERDQSVLDSLGAKMKRQFGAKTPNQAKYLEALEKKIVILGVGPAGTGKTYMACGHAARMLKSGQIDRIIITRPLVPCGRGYGFKKGTFEEKVLPEMRPMLDAFREFFGHVELDKLMKEKRLEVLPLDDMRGCSLPKTVLICDEAQNAELNQLHMLLTRFGEGSKVIITGDDSRSQTDLRTYGENPLRIILKNFEPNCHKDVSIIRLTRADIVRHPLIQWIDERLTEGPPKQPLNLPCPNCNSYMGCKLKDLSDVIRCWKCKCIVEPYDHEGKLDPIVIHEIDGLSPVMSNAIIK